MMPRLNANELTQRQLVFMIIALLAIWSAIFSYTFTNPFEWDDLHLIRPYSVSELLSTFHGPNDPDHIETPALRPLATMFFHLQGTVFGENMVLQRAFMVIVMAAFLWTVGLLLRELGLSLYHIVIVFVLLVSSRVFASLMLWLVMGSLLLAYIFMTLSALFYLRWMKRGSRHLLILTFVFTALAAFSREEAYTLPIALPLIWWLSTRDHSNYRSALMGAVGAFAIIICHYALRSILITGAPQPGLNVSRALTAVVSAAFPGGVQTTGIADRSLEYCWALFLAWTVFAFFRIADRGPRQIVFGICVLGLVLSTPALAVARSFGVALPALAFFTGIAVTVVEIHRYYLSRGQKQTFVKSIPLVCVIGLALGIASGVSRSGYVAQSLNEDSTEAVLHNSRLLFDQRVTIPTERRQRFLAHLNTLGISSRDGWEHLAAQDRSVDTTTLPPPMFKAKYGYLLF
jgi:hypothetical protein